MTTTWLSFPWASSEEIGWMANTASARSAALASESVASRRTGLTKANGVRSFIKKRARDLALQPFFERSHGDAISLHEHEMDLVHVKFVTLERAIFDDPVFGCALPGHNRWRRIHVVRLRLLTSNGDIKIGVVF